MNFHKLLTAKQIAASIGVTEGCLAKWRMSGEGPRYIKVQRRIMYDPNDVQVWLDVRRVASTSQEAA